MINTTIMKKLLNLLILGVVSNLGLMAQTPVYKLSDDPTGLPGKNFVVTIEWPANAAYTNVAMYNAFVGVLFHDSTSLTRTNVQGGWTNSVAVSKDDINAVCGASINPDSFQFQHYRMQSVYQFGDRTSGGSDTLFRLTSATYVSTGKIQLITNTTPSGTVDACMYNNGVKNTGSIDPAYPSAMTGYDIPGTGGSLALPVELLDLSASWLGEDGYLKWVTASEMNNSHFEIERSFDGIHFENVGRVYSKSISGTSNSVLSYSFVDQNVKPLVQDFVYYRLVQYDFDGAFERLGPVVLSVNQSKKMAVNVYPNPTENTVHVSFDQPTHKGLNIHVTDMTGRVIESRQVQANSTVESFDLGHLDRGFYFIIINKLNTTYTQKVLVH